MNAHTRISSKGQVVIRDAASVEKAWKRLGGSRLLLERYVSFQHELSVIGVRDQAGREVFYPPIENLHRVGPPPEAVTGRHSPGLAPQPAP